jgi:hypothetical protein
MTEMRRRIRLLNLHLQVNGLVVSLPHLSLRVVGSEETYQTGDPFRAPHNPSFPVPPCGVRTWACGSSGCGDRQRGLLIFQPPAPQCMGFIAHFGSLPRFREPRPTRPATTA